MTTHTTPVSPDELHALLRPELVQRGNVQTLILRPTVHLVIAGEQDVVLNSGFDSDSGEGRPFSRFDNTRLDASGRPIVEPVRAPWVPYGQRRRTDQIRRSLRCRRP